MAPPAIFSYSDRERDSDMYCVEFREYPARAWSHHRSFSFSPPPPPPPPSSHPPRLQFFIWTFRCMQFQVIQRPLNGWGDRW